MISNENSKEYVVSKLVLISRIIIFSIAGMILEWLIFRDFYFASPIFHGLMFIVVICVVVLNVMNSYSHRIIVDAQRISHTFFKNSQRLTDVINFSSVLELRLLDLGNKFKIIDFIWPSVRNLKKESIVWSREKGIVNEDIEIEKHVTLGDGGLNFYSAFIEVVDINQKKKKIPILDIKNGRQLVDEIVDRLEKSSQGVVM